MTLGTPAGTSRGFAVAAVLVAATAWATTGTLVILALDRVAIDGLTLALVRAAAATLALWAILLVANPGALRVGRADLPALAGYGLWAITVFYVATVYGIAGTSASVGITLLYIAPALVTLVGAAWLGEPLTAAKVAALILSFVGVVLVSRVWNPAELAGSPTGVAWAIVAAIAYAGYSLFGKRLVGRLAAPTVLAWYLLFGTLGLIAAKALVSPGAWPPPRHLLAISLAMGLLTTLLPTSLYLFALTRLPSSEASILAAIEPVVAVGLAALVLGERLDPLQALGAAMVVSAVLLLNLRRSARARPGGA